MLLGPDPEESQNGSEERLQSPHLRSDAAPSASEQTSQESITGELALVPPVLGASQRLLNRDHYQAYYQVPRVIILQLCRLLSSCVRLEYVTAVRGAASGPVVACQQADMFLIDAQFSSSAIFYTTLRLTSRANLIVSAANLKAICVCT